MASCNHYFFLVRFAHMSKSDLTKGLIIGFLMGLFFIIIGHNVIDSIQEGIYWFSISYFYLLPLIFPCLICIWLLFTSLIGKKFPIIYQIGRFLSVGALNASISLGVLNALLMITGITEKDIIIYALISVFSNSLGIINSYFWNKAWTFKKELKAKGKEFFLFYIFTGIGVLINMAITVLFARIIGPALNMSGGVLIGLIAPICGILTEAVWNFIIYKLLIFKNEQPSTV